MHRAGLIVWDVLTVARTWFARDVTTLELDEFAERRAAEQGARPAFKDYRGYPACSARR